MFLFLSFKDKPNLHAFRISVVFIIKIFMCKEFAKKSKFINAFL